MNDVDLGKELPFRKVECGKSRPLNMNGYERSRSGAIVRTGAKRDRSISGRQWRKMRKANVS